MVAMHRIPTLLSALAALLAFAGTAIAQPPPPKAEGIESEGYEWNEMIGEKMEALQLTGDLAP